MPLCELAGAPVPPGKPDPSTGTAQKGLSSGWCAEQPLSCRAAVLVPSLVCLTTSISGAGFVAVGAQAGLRLAGVGRQSL